MGCGNTKTAPVTRQEPSPELRITIDRVQRTWPVIKKIDNLGPKVFAHLLHTYPVLKRISKVSPTIKTEADLLRANEVRDLGNMLLAVYADIIKNAHMNLYEKIENKAIVLNRQNIQPRLIKHFSESLSHIATHQIHIKLTPEEKQSWVHFTDHVSNKLTEDMESEYDSPNYQY